LLKANNLQKSLFYISQPPKLAILCKILYNIHRAMCYGKTVLAFTGGQTTKF